MLLLVLQGGWIKGAGVLLLSASDAADQATAAAAEIHDAAGRPQQRRSQGLPSCASPSSPSWTSCAPSCPGACVPGGCRCLRCSMSKLGRRRGRRQQGRWAWQSRTAHRRDESSSPELSYRHTTSAEPPTRRLHTAAALAAVVPPHPCSLAAVCPGRKIVFSRRMTTA